jgi:hypothetical protein
MIGGPFRQPLHSFYRPFRAGRFMNRHLGLKPQAESYSPFGTKSDTSLRDKNIASRCQRNMRTAFRPIGSEYSTLNPYWVALVRFAGIKFQPKLV